MFLDISQNSPENTCARVSFLIKLQALGLQLWHRRLLKKRLWHRRFHVNFAKYLRTPFLQNTSGWLHLEYQILHMIYPKFIFWDSSWETFVLKTSFVFVFRRRLDQNEYVRLTYSSSEDVLVKTNIFVLAIRLQDVFKTSSKCLQGVLQRCLQDVFKTYHES